MGKVTVVGLTGSIGMGKSAAAGALRAMGLPVHEADAAVHALLAPNGAAVETVGKAFPPALKENLDREYYIDRQVLGRIVFNDAAKMKELEDILHPMVRRVTDAFVEEMKKNHDIIVLDIPLLFETAGEKRVDKIIVVTAPEEEQRARVLMRPGMTPEKLARILASQTPDAEKRRRADYVVETDSGFDAMRGQLEAVIAQIRALQKP